MVKRVKAVHQSARDMPYQDAWNMAIDEPLSILLTPAPVFAEGDRLALLATCLSPAEKTFAVASGLATIARWAADAATDWTDDAWASVSEWLPAILAKISGRDEKYLCTRHFQKR